MKCRSISARCLAVCTLTCWFKATSRVSRPVPSWMQSSNTLRTMLCRPRTMCRHVRLSWRPARILLGACLWPTKTTITHLSSTTAKSVIRAMCVCAPHWRSLRRLRMSHASISFGPRNSLDTWCLVVHARLWVKWVSASLCNQSVTRSTSSPASMPSLTSSCDNCSL